MKEFPNTNKKEDTISEQEFEKTLKLTRYALLLSGIKTSNDPLNKVIDYFIKNYLYTFNFIILYTVLFGETYWVVDGMRTSRPFVELSLISPCITISVLSTIKSWFLYINKGTLLKVVAKLKEIHPSFVDEDGIEREIIIKSMKMLKFVQVLLLSIYILVVSTFCCTPLLISWYNYHKNGEYEITYPYVIKYPFDVYKSKFWPLIYFHEIWATFIVICNVFGCDTLFYALCVYLNMHFHLLGIQFKNCVSPSKFVTRSNLARAVVRHWELINLVDQSEILYSKSSLFNILTSSILICLSAFNITVTEQATIMFAFITFLLMSLSQISMMCYFGDLLMKSSMEINEYVYNCQWYDADEVSKKTILMVMVRSQKACRLTAWKFTVLNLGAFTTILSRSWSYFALLKTVYK